MNLDGLGRRRRERDPPRAQKPRETRKRIARETRKRIARETRKRIVIDLRSTIYKYK